LGSVVQIAFDETGGVGRSDDAGLSGFHLARLSAFAMAAGKPSA
jgi:hypothetical protein